MTRAIEHESANDTVFVFLLQAAAATAFYLMASMTMHTVVY